MLMHAKKESEPLKRLQYISRQRMIENAFQEFLSKYRPSPYAASIVRPEVLDTTLRLDPE
jgi:hypothetical protein